MIFRQLVIDSNSHTTDAEEYIDNLLAETQDVMENFYHRRFLSGQFDETPSPSPRQGSKWYEVREFFLHILRNEVNGEFLEASGKSEDDLIDTIYSAACAIRFRKYEVQQIRDYQIGDLTVVDLEVDFAGRHPTPNQWFFSVGRFEHGWKVITQPMPLGEEMKYSYEWYLRSLVKDAVLILEKHDANMKYKNEPEDAFRAEEDSGLRKDLSSLIRDVYILPVDYDWDDPVVHDALASMVLALLRFLNEEWNTSVIRRSIKDNYINLSVRIGFESIDESIELELSNRLNGWKVIGTPYWLR